MKTHSKIAVVIVVLGIIAIASYKFIAPILDATLQRDTSDARVMKGTITIGVDNWIGYYPLCSEEMRKRMRAAGYLVKCNDDHADYPARFRQLKHGDIQFAVGTVDSYLLNGPAVHYPGSIISVIDESKGGDAIVAWTDKVKNLDTLKTARNIHIALTPASPSDHLLKTIGVHFDIPMLLDRKGKWRIETQGSPEALQLLLKKKADVAVLWEPDVSRALNTPGIHKLIGTEQTDKLIVDILIANREFTKKNPVVVRELLVNYFRTIKFYQDNPERLINDASSDTGLGKKIIESMLKGVRWINLTENAQKWYGITRFGIQSEEGLIETIESTAQILLDYKDFTQSPIPNDDPYRLTQSQFVSDLYQTLSAAKTSPGTTAFATASAALDDSLDKKFSALSDLQWNALKEIGTLKIRPILFRSGTSTLTQEGKEQVDIAVDTLKHYPYFRVLIKGHTNMLGDPRANKLLSKQRAEAVAQYIHVTYGVDFNRLHAVGYGGEQPLPREAGESERAYNYRLPRVELYLVAEDI